MLIRLRQGLLFLLTVAFGYFLGSGPVAEWSVDTYHLLSVEWASQRIAGGSNGSLPLLLAGFLLGQGIFLFARRVRTNLGPARARSVEQIAAWDPALSIPTRFGLHRYLEGCVRWAAEDPTSRTQSLALFKIRGLGRLNEKYGTMATTQLLQRIAAECRAESLPESASPLKRWVVRYLPRPLVVHEHRMPPARYPARWSGATFALAFRELEAAQAVSICRELAAWIKTELSILDASEGLSLCATIAIGIPSVTSRGLAAAAMRGLQLEHQSLITVVHDPADVRANVIGQMTDVTHEGVTMARRSGSEDAQPLHLDLAQRGVLWLRTWGPSLGCVIAALACLLLLGGKATGQPNVFAWPDNLAEVQVVDSAGPRSVRLQRSSPAAASSGKWSLSDVRVVQGVPQDGVFAAVQVHVEVSNMTRHTFFVSSYDFEAIDEKGRHLQFDPRGMVRMIHGITGKWLDPGESWSGWLRANRLDAPIKQIVFEPDGHTRIVVEAR